MDRIMEEAIRAEGGDLKPGKAYMITKPFFAGGYQDPRDSLGVLSQKVLREKAVIIWDSVGETGPIVQVYFRKGLEHAYAGYFELVEPNQIRALVQRISAYKPNQEVTLTELEQILRNCRKNANFDWARFDGNGYTWWGWLKKLFPG